MPGRSEFTFARAQELAARLVTIGHPQQQAAIDATALDLMHWCTGYDRQGPAVSPDQQAEQLVEHARREWEVGWPERGGTKQLRDAFDRLFPTDAPHSPDPTTAELIRRGHWKPPCEHCPPGADHCEFLGTQGHAKELETEAYWQRQRAPQKAALAPPPPLNGASH